LILLENKLKEHPHFMRTAKAYLVNLTKVRGFKFSSSRDLWFEGLAEPVKNAVTSSYKDDFDTALGIKVDGVEEANS
ncbi:MAG: hypothetical protein PHQ41_05380, partial [Candidatus Cloacimonetes bacterium]|nr:hypothetical protein [Candidatus Cloacimonadota bacterium]